jgi:hypothetical protein
MTNTHSAFLVLSIVAGGALLSPLACSKTDSSTAPPVSTTVSVSTVGSGGAGGAGGAEGTGGAGGGTGGAGGGTGGATGSTTCSDLIGTDPSMATWSTTEMASDFTGTDAFMAWDALNTCACVNTLAMSGCSDVCTMGANGTTTPNFCDSGKTPNQSTTAGSCYACLTTTCMAEITACQAD